MQQEVSIFYDGVNVTIRKLLDSQGPMTKKDMDTNKELIKEFMKHLTEYHNPREDVTRSKGNGDSEDLAVVMEKLENMDQKMTKMGHSLHAIQARCDNYNGPNLTKDCDLDENGNRKAQV